VRTEDAAKNIASLSWLGYDQGGALSYASGVCFEPCAGQATSQEMCFLFTYAYPKLALKDNGPEGTLMHGEGVCLGQ
jgi:hypothetical protein